MYISVFFSFCFLTPAVYSSSELFAVVADSCITSIPTTRYSASVVCSHWPLERNASLHKMCHTNSNLGLDWTVITRRRLTARHWLDRVTKQTLTWFNASKNTIMKHRLIIKHSARICDPENILSLLDNWENKWVNQLNPLKGRGVNWLHFAILVSPVHF